MSRLLNDLRETRDILELVLRQDRVAVSHLDNAIAQLVCVFCGEELGDEPTEQYYKNRVHTRCRELGIRREWQGL